MADNRFDGQTGPDLSVLSAPVSGSRVGLRPRWPGVVGLSIRCSRWLAASPISGTWPSRSARPASPMARSWPMCCRSWFPRWWSISSWWCPSPAWSSCSSGTRRRWPARQGHRRALRPAVQTGA